MPASHDHDAQSDSARRGDQRTLNQGDRTLQAELTAAQSAADEAFQDAARFRTIFENSPLGIYRTTPDGRIVDANPAIVQMLGYASFEELTQRNLNEEGFEPAYSRAEFMERIEAAGEIVGMETAWRRRDGQLIFVRENARVTRDAQGRVQYYEGTVEDITERRRAEEALRASERRLALLYEEAPLAYQSLDEHGHFLNVNHAWSRILGYTADEVRGRWFAELLPAAHRPRFRGCFEQFKKHGEVHGIEFELRCKDGRVITARFDGRIAHDQQGGFKQTHCMLQDVTEVKQAEQAVARERRLFIGGPVVVFRRRVEDGWPVEYVSPNVQRLLGYEAADFTERGLSFSAIMPAREFERVRDMFQKHDAAGEASFSLDYRVVRSDGELRWLGEHAVIVRDAEGRITHSEGYVLDMTERKEAEARLAESEARYQVLVRNIPNSAVHLFDPDLRLILSDGPLLQSFGLSTRGLRGTRLPQFLPSAVHQRIEPHLYATIAGERRSFTFDMGGRTVEVHTTPVKDDAGRIIGGMALTLDVSARVQMERALRETEERLRLLIENAEDIISIHDLDGVFLYCNGPKRYGIESAQLIGRRLTDVLSPADAAPILANLRAVAESGTSQMNEYSIDWQGEELWFSDVAFPVRDTRNRIVSVGRICRDITIQKRTECELAAHREHLEELVQQRTAELETSREQARHVERLASLGTLAAGVAHEVNNPVGGMMLAAEQMLASLEDRAQIATLAREILADGRRVRAVTSGMLQFARSAGREKVAGDLNEVVQRAVDMTRDYAAERSCVVSLRPHEAPLCVTMNPTEMEQVAVNLIRNAIASDARNVTVMTDRVADHARLTVRDNGRGISAADRPRVFEPFYTTRQSTGGTGLGLSITHGIVQEHAGAIGIEDADTAGTTLVVTLPLVSGRGKDGP